jgi:hypothetical protein
MAQSSYTIVKQASTLQGIVDDVMASAGKTWQDVNFRQRPFYTIFKYLTPSWLMFRGNFVLAALMALAEEFLGMGPSTLGAMIDAALGLGASGGATTVSDAGLMQASKGLVDKVLGTSMLKSNSFAESVRKNGVTTEAMLAAWAAGPDMQKEAASARSKLNLFKRWLGKTGRGERIPIIAMVYSLLKKFVLGMGLFTGIKLVRKQFERPKPFGLPIGLPGAGVGVGKPTAPSGARMVPGAGFAEWENAGGVERSIIMALNRAVRDRRGRPFSVLFADIQGVPLRGSGPMRRLLEDVRMAHGWAPLRELDRSRYFLAPPIMEAARRLLPQMKYSPGRRVDTTDAEKRLKRILGKKPPQARAPSGGGAESTLGRILGGGKQ